MIKSNDPTVNVEKLKKDTLQAINAMQSGANYLYNLFDNVNWCIPCMNILQNLQVLEDIINDC